MANLKEKAKEYEPKQVHNIAELESISTDSEVKSDEEAEFPYDYIEINNERYKVPTSVIASLKAILEENPSLKKFKVKKSGEGMNTKYTVIPLA